MIPLTILRLLVNGRPFLPSLDGRSGSTTAHCSSVKASNRVNSLTWPVSGKPNSTYRRHALAKGFSDTAFSANLLAKDIRLMLGVADGALPAATAFLDALTTVQRTGDGEDDFTAALRHDV